MEFKIDTRESYTRIGSAGEHLDANMAATLEEKASRLTDSGSHNFLIDLSSCQTAEESGFEALANWHESSYSEGRSLVFTGLSAEVLRVAREAQLEGAINIAPTEIEGIDIISMEILERDLFDEES